MSDHKKPHLRFPAFSNDWHSIKLGELLSFKNGINAEKHQYGKGIKFINVLDIINNNSITYDKIIGSVDISPSEYEKNEVKYGDILFQRSSETREEVGQANVYLDHKPAVFGGFVIRGRGIKVYDPAFLNFVLKTDTARKQITDKSGGSTRYNIGQESLEKVSIVLPVLQEQQKIATFLTAVDNKIQQLTKKKSLLEQYKKGVIQQIFSKQIRFKDENGKYYPNWKEKEVVQIFEFLPSHSFSRSELAYESGEVKSVHYGDIHMKFNPHFRVNQDNAPFILGSISQKINHDNYCKEGDLIIADASEDYADIGKSIEVMQVDHQKLLAGLHTFHLREKQHHFVLGYKAYLMQDQFVRDQIMKLATGVSVLGISKSNLSKLKIKIPAIDEQRKIVDFLTAIDCNIKTISKELDKTQTFKKGLLQQMFV